MKGSVTTRLALSMAIHSFPAHRRLVSNLYYAMNCTFTTIIIPVNLHHMLLDSVIALIIPLYYIHRVYK